MRYDKVITLVAETFTTDAIGQQVPVETSREVFANEFSLAATEFYAAGAAGLKPERVWQVRAADYAAERLVDAEGIRFAVVRIDRRGAEFVRLVCERTPT